MKGGNNIKIYTNENFEFLVKRFRSRMEFSNMTKISINTIKAILDKKVKPSIDTLIKLRNFFDVSLDDLVFTNLSEEQKNPISCY